MAALPPGLTVKATAKVSGLRVPVHMDCDPFHPGGGRWGKNKYFHSVPARWQGQLREPGPRAEEEEARWEGFWADPLSRQARGKLRLWQVLLLGALFLFQVRHALGDPESASRRRGVRGACRGVPSCLAGERELRDGRARSRKQTAERSGGCWASLTSSLG